MPNLFPTSENVINTPLTFGLLAKAINCLIEDCYISKEQYRVFYHQKLSYIMKFKLQKKICIYKRELLEGHD